MKKVLIPWAVLALASAQGHATQYCGNGQWADNCATPTILVTLLGGTGGGDVQIDGANVSVLVSDSQVTTVRIDTPTPSSLGIVSVSRSSSLPLTLEIGTVNRVGSVGHIIVQGADVDLVGDMGSLGSGQTISTLASIGVSGAGLTVRGDVNSDIVLARGAYGRLSVGRVAVSGNLNGSIIAQRGSIDRISLSSRNSRIGSASNQVIISAWGDINEVIAPEINAFIDAGVTFDSTYPAQASNIKSVVTDKDLGSGNFTGLLRADAIGQPRVPLLNDDDKRFSNNAPPQINIGNDFGAPGSPTQLYIREGVRNVEIATQPSESRRPVVIGGTIRNANSDPNIPEILLPANGLIGQIIAGNNGLLASPADGWESGVIVRIGATQLNSASYATLPGSIGGGAIGVARFDLHGMACTPAQDTLIMTSPPPTSLGAQPDCSIYSPSNYGPTFADLQLYGPVQFDGAMPLIVQRRPNFLSSWEDISSNFTAALVDGVGAQANLQYSRIRVTGTGSGLSQKRFYGDFDYRIIPRTGANGLKCRGVAGAPDVASFEYRFKVAYSCSDGLLGVFDMNHDHDLNAGDLSAWMNTPADFNADGAANSTDLRNLVDAVVQYQNLPQ